MAKLFYLDEDSITKTTLALLGIIILFSVMYFGLFRKVMIGGKEFVPFLTEGLNVLQSSPFILIAFIGFFFVTEAFGLNILRRTLIKLGI